MEIKCFVESFLNIERYCYCIFILGGRVLQNNGEDGKEFRIEIIILCLMGQEFGL